MSDANLKTLLGTFRRQLLLIHVLRAAGLLVVIAAILWSAGLPPPRSKYATLVTLGAAFAAWVLVVAHAINRGREVQTGSMLLAAGQLDDAEVWFRRVIQRISLSVHAKILACQQMASLSFRRKAHQDVVTICEELLRHRVRRVQNVWVNTRLMLADSLLMLSRTSEAYGAIRPLYDTPLTLADRMKLLPIQLRYELASDHAAAAVSGLPEKIRIAELLDSPRAALIHALLAEACRRQDAPAQRDLLSERARLYHDLDELASMYDVIKPVAGSATPPEAPDNHEGTPPAA